MEILTYLQARKLISADIAEERVRAILTISGCAREWIAPVATTLAKLGLQVPGAAIVESSGMGRAILQAVPREEWVYLLNPSLAPQASSVVQQQIVRDGRLFSQPLGEWLRAQELGPLYTLSLSPFTPDEAKVTQLLWQQQEAIVDREQIAVSLWGDAWSEKYSDWGIDALMHRLRKKVGGSWQLVTVKGRGYMLAGVGSSTQALKPILGKAQLIQEIAGSIYPSDEYLMYMNDPHRGRKVYRDLFAAMEREKISVKLPPGATILCVNSYSYDNVDSVVQWVKSHGDPNVRVYFVHYDPRAVQLHAARIQELGVGSFVESTYDDLRASALRSASFDLVINDFRLNFNQNDQQNRAMLMHTQRILREGGHLLLSTVVDGRYENIRYGADQERAPVNAQKPGLFQADEHLVRRCWSVPYYRQLFAKTGFGTVQEFDIEEGKRWGGGNVTLTVNPWSGPYYRRWVMEKD